MSDNTELVEKLVRRVWPDYTRERGLVLVQEVEGGLFMSVREREPQRTVARLYHDRASSTTYLVPSGVPNGALMARAVADPDRRARLQVV